MLKRTVQLPGGSTEPADDATELPVTVAGRILIRETSSALVEDERDLSNRTLGVLTTQRELPSGQYQAGDERTLEPAPMKIGRFVVLREIGEGAMSRVYLAHDPELDRRVAIKLLRTSGADDDLLRHQREAQALARISHPNVVQIYETINLGNRTFIVMEFITGITLTAWQSDHPRALMELLAMYVAVGRGLVAAHSVGVVHRDFKPDNVIVDTEGRPRVADFGLASIRGRADRAATSHAPGASISETSDGVILGTPAYMPPEQYSSSQVGESADQFSFCAALFEALYGERPYPGDTLEELRAGVSAGQLREPPLDRRAPPAIHGALLRGLAHDPSARWPSLAALLDHLAHYDPGRDPTLARRQQRSFTLLLDVLMLVVGGVMLTVSSHDPAALTPVALIVPVAVVLVISGVYMWILREHLIAHRFHWLMLRILLVLVGACLVGRVSGAMVGQDSAGVLLLGLVGAGSVAATITIFVAPVLWSIAAVQLTAAALVATHLGPLTVIDVLAQTMSVLAFTRAWRASTGDVVGAPALTPGSRSDLSTG